MPFVNYVIENETKQMEFWTACLTILFSSIGIVMSLSFMIFNIKFRNFRLIKMSSPNLNNIIISNCIFLYLCPIFNSIKGLNIQNESIGNLMCQLNSIIIPICSTAIYASMLTKCWRIYKIFDTTPKLKKIVIKDLRLIYYISIMILIDLIVIFIWLFFDTIKLKSRFISETQSKYTQIIVSPSYLAQTTKQQIKNHSIITNVGPIIQNFTHTNQLKLLVECNSNYNEVWITILTMYKICLTMYGIYLAWITRNFFHFNQTYYKINF